jgi:C-terminal processing protease CtpA/Prc
LAYLQANTNGLIVDVMHNPGGNAIFEDAVYSYLSPQPYQQLQAVWRPTIAFATQAAQQLYNAEASGADQGTVAFYRTMLQQVEAAYAQGADLTAPYPLIGTTVLRNPAVDNQGNSIAYSKPIMLLTDDLTVSAADAFAATFQDNKRGIIFGIRTNGAGGNLGQFRAGPYSEGGVTYESNLNIRNHTVSVPGYPPTQYFDNVGVQPDIVQDLMTKDNLIHQGAGFSQAMVAAITSFIQQAHN